MNDYDDIEILDIFDDEKEEKNNEINKEQKLEIENVPVKKKQSKKPSGKTKIIQIIFCSISALFILGCCIFYGTRLIKYYKIYNPSGISGEKALLLSNKISNESEIVYEGNGLYLQNGTYIYKGNVSNNYIKYNNLLWRIVKINNDGTMQIILDDYINILNWNKESVEYKKSSINKYLNDYLIKLLDKDLLVKSNYCGDKIDDLGNITCTIQDNEYVTLLEVTSYLNSVIDKNTYLSDTDEIFWLNNYGSEKVWHTNGSNVSQSDANSLYEIRPVVTLKSTIPYISGDGTKENPYETVKSNKLTVGSIVKLDEDKWYVYEINDTIKLTLANNLDKQYHFDKEKVTYDIESTGSLAEYLNNDYLDNLSYKDLLKETNWNIGSFKESYIDVETDSIKAKVGLLNIKDIKLNSDINGYYLGTSFEEKYVYAYEEVLKTSKPSLYRNIRPCIALDKDIELKGEGTIDSPFEVEE